MQCGACVSMVINPWVGLGVLLPVCLSIGVRHLCAGAIYLSIYLLSAYLCAGAHAPSEQAFPCAGLRFLEDVLQDRLSHRTQPHLDLCGSRVSPRVPEARTGHPVPAAGPDPARGWDGWVGMGWRGTGEWHTPAAARHHPGWCRGQ